MYKGFLEMFNKIAVPNMMGFLQWLLHKILVILILIFNLPNSTSFLTIYLNNYYAYLTMKPNQNFSRELLLDFINITKVFADSFLNLNHLCERF